MRTLLQIVQAASLELGLPTITAVANSADRQAQQLFGLANRVGTELAETEGAWNALRGEHLFSTVAGVDNYPLPADLNYYIPQTAWNRSQHWRLDGPMSASDWQVLKSGIYPSGVYARFRIMSGKLFLDPVPSSVDSIAIEYVSANWCQSAANVPQPLFVADSDMPLLPDDLFVLGLKWRFKAEKGFDFSVEREAYDAAVSRLLPRDTMLEMIPIAARNWSVLNPGLLPAGNWPGR